ncbi:MAG: 50S ribosomal protein L10 [Spirochaetaceae bacterium]|nr:50S ribosomal protein L10 [Spirochaetaceae bacterium]
MEKKIKVYKANEVELVKNELAGSGDVFFTEYRGLTVPQITSLRKSLRSEGASYKVSKNNLAKIAFKEAGKPAGDDFFKGPTAIVYTKGESGPVAKILVNFAKENDKLVIKGGLVDNELYDAAKITAYGNLPSRLEMLAMVASTVNGVASKLVRTLQAVVDKKQAEG